MNEVVEFFRGLFETNHWPPRWKCGYWTDFHGWIYIISELMIWLAYFLIPLIILNYVTRKKTGIRFRKVYFLFASFILLCGSTHFIDALMFWVPMYRFNAVVRLTTGTVSLFTVYHLVQILPSAFKLKTNLELEKEIARREEAERKLEEANKELETFAYIASHDLQEPLRKIRTFTSMLQQANAKTFDSRSKELADKIATSTGRMQTLIKDVLTLSTLDENIELSEICVNDAIKDAIEDLEFKIDEKDALINIGALPAVKGNKAYISQLFLNLINNAIKFTDKQPIIDIKGEEKDGRAFIYVSDNGIGIDKDHFEKIFTAFQRLHSKSKYEGSGIGLAICKKIVDIHGGRIHVDSKLGEGTTFTIELPLA